MEDDYQNKLKRIIADIEAGNIEKLTMQLGRDRYQMRDNRTRRAQKELLDLGFLIKRGKLFAVAA